MARRKGSVSHLAGLIPKRNISVSQAQGPLPWYLGDLRDCAAPTTEHDLTPVVYYRVPCHSPPEVQLYECDEWRLIANYGRNMHHS